MKQLAGKVALVTGAAQGIDRGRHLDWPYGICRPGYEGVARLFGELQGDARFTIMAALSSEMYLTYDADDPVADRIAGCIHHSLMDGDLAQAIFNLLVAGLDLPPDVREELHNRFMHRVAHFSATLDASHAARIGAFNRAVMRPLRRRVAEIELGLTGERLLARMDRRYADLKRLLQSYFDYALLATHFREAKVGEVEQSSGKRHCFHIVTMPSGARRKQFMYDLTARVVDAVEITVNFVIVFDWARTGWNVIRPNLLIDATATRNVTAWQQLRGRALRAWPSWTNDCYRLLSVLIGHHLLSGVEVEADGGGALERGMLEILEEIATPAQVETLVADGIQALPAEERQALAVRLMQQRNKVTHIYELIKATGSTSQIEYDRTSQRWRRKENVAAKHEDEVSVNPFTGEKSRGPQHAPLVYARSPRTDAPSELQQHLSRRLAGCDAKIIGGWLAEERPTGQADTQSDREQLDRFSTPQSHSPQEEVMHESNPSSTALAGLEAAYGPPSQAAFGSAVFGEALDANTTLETVALDKYRCFVGDLWTRYGEDAWIGPWREVYARPSDAKADIVTELGAISDADAALSASMVLDNDANALAAVFDDPAVTELRVYNIGDGEAMSGLVIAAQRGAAQEATVLVFLMD
jgi:hypothetical protein